MKGTLGALLGLIVAALLVAGCGSGGGSSSSSSGSGGAETTAVDSAGSEIVPAPPTTPPTENPVTIPLSKKPPSGKKVIWLQCELPACELFNPGLEEATEALGWSYETIVFPAAEPGKALSEAVAQKPDFIAMSGIPTAVMKPQMAEAHKAGIPVISCSTVERASPEGYAAQCVGTEENEAEYIGRWMINDSGGNAHAAVITLPQYPVLGTEMAYFENKFTKECGGCGFEELDITPEEIGAGTVPQKVVGFLQAHPETNYVYSTFNDPARGLPQTIESAGLADKVKIVGAAADASIIQAIPDQFAAFTQAPHNWMSWSMVDAMARLANGEKLSQKYLGQIYRDPIWVVDSKESSESLKEFGYEWPGPEGFQESFEELWQLK
jgi:ABC-type sugar transport system substrate-binding protein